MSQLQAKQTSLAVVDMLTKNKSKIIEALPDNFKYGRMIKIVSNAIMTTPALAKCTPMSLFMSCVQSACMGIEPNGPLAHGYLVPFNKKEGNGWISQAQFMPSYRGLIELSRRTGSISSVYAEVIRANDLYSIKRGTDNKLEHEIKIGDRGEPIAYYAVFVDQNGNTDFEVMDLAEIDHIKNKSKAKDFGPWKTDPVEMSKKTVLKRLLKRAPMSIEDNALASAVQADHKVSMGENDLEGIIDIEGMEIPPDANKPVEAKVEETAPAVDLPPSQQDEPPELELQDQK